MSQGTEVKSAFKRGDLVQHVKIPGKVWRVWKVTPMTGSSIYHACRGDMVLPPESEFGDYAGKADVDWICCWEDKISLVPEVTPPQVEEVKAPCEGGHTFEFGDLIEGAVRYATHLNCGKYKAKYAVVTHSRPSKCEGDNCIAFCAPEDFHLVKKPLTYVEMKSEGIDGNGWQPRYLRIAAKAGQWHLKDGTVVLSPEVKPSVTPKSSVPMFKYHDLVTHTNTTTGVVTEWEVVSEKPDEDGLIILCKRGGWKLEKPFTDGSIHSAFGLSQIEAGLYRLAYESDVVLDAPKQDTTCSGKCCGSCDKPVVPKFNRGDLVKHEWNGTQVVVSDELDEGIWVTCCKPEYLHDTYEEDTYEDVEERLGEGTADGYLPKSLELLAPAGGWTMIAGKPVIVAQPVPEPVVHQFKEGDKVRVVKAMPEWRYWKREMDLAVGGSGEINGLHTYSDDGLTAASVTINSVYEPFYYPLSCLELVPPQPAFKPGDMVVDTNDQLWDVDGVTREGSVWISSKALVGIKLVSASTLKKVVFGTL